MRDATARILALALAILALLLASASLAETEREAAIRLAPKYGARLEVALADGSRADMVTDLEAIEVDWARKWAEAIGQSLFYASMLQKRPAVMLLKSSDRDDRYVRRCKRVCDIHGITLYVEPATKGPRPRKRE